MASLADGEQAVVGVACPVVGPDLASIAGAGGRVDGGLFVEEVAVDSGEVVQAGHPVGGGVQIRDAGQCQRQTIERCAGVGARSAGGVATHDALDVHQAALHVLGGPEGFDGGLGSLAAVGGDQQWGGDAGQ